MIGFEHKLKMDYYPVHSGRKKIFEEWAKRHDTHLLYDLFEPHVYFSSIEDLTMFKLEFGGEHVDTLREG